MWYRRVQQQKGKDYIQVRQPKTKSLWKKPLLMVVSCSLSCCCQKTPWPKTTHGRVHLAFRFQRNMSPSSQADMTARVKQGSSSRKLRDTTSSTASTSREQIEREMRIYTLKSCPDGALPVARLHLKLRNFPLWDANWGPCIKTLSLLRAYSPLSQQRKVSIV